MDKLIIALLVLIFNNFCKAQSLEENIIYATQFGDEIYLNEALKIRIKKLGSTTIIILESDEDGQVTRELLRLSDSTFLYSEYFPLSFEKYFTLHASYGVIKEGILIVSNETVVDSSVMWGTDIFEPLPSPRLRKILKPIGQWFEIYKNDDKNYKVIGSYNINGRHGEWAYYTNRRDPIKILTFENGKLTNQKVFDILHYESMEETQKLIQRTWACSTSTKTLSTNHTSQTKKYEFKQDGTFYLDGEKGTWEIIDYKTIVFKVGNKEKTLKLEYVSENRIRYQY